jgi:hypothetical protein
MSAPCIDAPCCGCCYLAADNEPPEEVERHEDELDDDGELARDRILEDEERSDFAHHHDTLPLLDDELGPWDWVTD